MVIIAGNIRILPRSYGLRLVSCSSRANQIPSADSSTFLFDGFHDDKSNPLLHSVAQHSRLEFLSENTNDDVNTICVI